METLSQDPIGAATRLLNDPESRFTQKPDGPSWIEPLLHKTLIYFTLLAVYYQDISTLEVYRPSLEYTRNEILRHCRETVSRFRPQLSSSIQEGLDHSFSKESFRPLTGSEDSKSVWKLETMRQ